MNFQMNRRWSSKQDAVLIAFVRKHELLYNIKHEEFRNFQLKQRLWNEIGKILNKREAECIKRWSYMRDYYMRHKRRTWTGSCREEWRKKAKRLSFLNCLPSLQKLGVTDVGIEDGNPEENTEDINEGMSFQNSEGDDGTCDNDVGDTNEDNDLKYDSSEEDSVNDEDINEYIDNKIDIYIKSEKNPQNISQTQERLSPVAETPSEVNEMDENDLFFSSMAKIAKRLPRYEQAKLRLQIGSLVGNVELRHLRNQQK